MTALRFVTCLLLLSMVTGRSAAASPSPRNRCSGPALRDLRIHLIAGAGVDPRTLDEAMEEASRIWTTAGVRLTWTVPPMDITDPGTVVLIVRRTLSRHSIVTSDSSRRGTDALGWVLFDGDDKRGPVEVSTEATTAVVMEGVLANKSVLTFPRHTQNHLLGRGLGRVIAHEIGHWRMGRAHMRGGLMKASLNPQDLIGWAAPPLPRQWTGGECEGRP